MSHERIVASVIVYYHTSEWLKGAGLSFRRLITEEEFKASDRINAQRAQTIGQAVEIGTIPTPQGRMLVFHNSSACSACPISVLFCPCVSGRLIYASVHSSIFAQCNTKSLRS
jgi:hypothetical protein